MCEAVRAGLVGLTGKADGEQGCSSTPQQTLPHSLQGRPGTTFTCLPLPLQSVGTVGPERIPKHPPQEDLGGTL